ncbi:MAG: HlyD family efflux transporter periplasmic adaptor subunit [Oscillospiraceae bacterium]|nr:HlyD family efflux transporter periplasmic adaptor subunit [Oscillospiraceae bacterium]
MTEQKVKKRGWVKDAAIIFLAVMLALTFFSNTIMNHSLPEVAAQYVQSGAINAKIRGTGTVTANESFEVKSEQVREVLSVPVQVGDEVKVGDTLLLFSDAESTELKTAQKELDDLMLKYQQDLIEASGSDYASDQRKIQIAQQKLDEAKAERDANVVTNAELATAKANYNRAVNAYDVQKLKADDLQSQFSGLSAGGDNSGIYAQISAKQSELSTAQSELSSAKLAYATDLANLEAYAKEWIVVDSKNSSDSSVVKLYTAALYKSFSASLAATTTPAKFLPYTGTTKGEPSEYQVTSMVTAYNTIETYNTKITSLSSDIATLQGSLNYGDSNYNTVKNLLKEANGTLTTLATVKQNYNDVYTDLQAKKTTYDAAVAAVNTNQDSLEAALETLATKKKTDSKTQLSLDAQKKQIATKKEELAKLQKGGEGSSIESKVNGKVASINVSAGKTTAADTALITIEVPDMGYGVSFSVTNEQSKKVKVGDAAEITNNYSGEELTATLVGIKSDPKNPSTNKMLNFKLQGEVESGSQLAITIGERGGSYDTLVPNSSIRSDNNGKFVLIVLAKNSALGNRYIAQRIDVKVVASDDVNTAVSGALTNNDMVITTSTKPIEPGTQVRLADG